MFFGFWKSLEDKWWFKNCILCLMDDGFVMCGKCVLKGLKFNFSIYRLIELYFWEIINMVI